MDQRCLRRLMAYGVFVDGIIVMATLTIMILSADDINRRLSTVLILLSGIHSVLYACRDEAEIAWHLQPSIRGSIIAAVGQIGLGIVLLTTSDDIAVRRLATTVVVLASSKFLMMAAVSFVYPTYFDPPDRLLYDAGGWQAARMDGSPLDPDIWSNGSTPQSAVVAYQLADRPASAGSFCKSPFSE